METSSNNNEDQNDNKFYPYTYPQPNMLVQSGSKVVIKGLTSCDASSVAGVQLNGLVGTALEFYADRHGHWSVQIIEQRKDAAGEEESDENDDESEKKKGETTTTTTAKEEAMIVMIPICHLEIVVPNNEQDNNNNEYNSSSSSMMYFPIVTRNNPRWAAGSRDGCVLLRAGTMMNGQPALCLYDDPNRDGFDPMLVYKQATYMGASQAMVDELLSGCGKASSLYQQQQQRHQHPTHHHNNNSVRRQQHHRSLLLSCIFVMIVGCYSLLTTAAADKLLLVPSLSLTT